MKKYKSLIFDCDGVILNSNQIKTISFKKALKDYNKNAVNEFINYHNTNGGISRYTKIRFFLEVILPKHKSNINIPENQYEIILKNYSYYCKNYLYKCEVAKGLEVLKDNTRGISWFIVSGGDQEELRDVFKQKKINHFFDGGIYGSPDSKDKIIKREVKKKNIVYPALFLGDSKLDHIAAKENNMDFIFVTNWTEFKSYKDYCRMNSLNKISCIFEINELFL